MNTKETYTHRDFGKFFGWDAIQRMMRIYRFLNLFGPPGSGKTFSAWKFGCELFGPERVARLSMNDDRTVPEILGHYIQGKNGMVWNALNLVPIYQNGGLVIIDELKLASSPVQDCFLEIMEDADGISKLTLTSGEVIPRHPEFRLIATHNDPPDFMNPALRDRFNVHLYVAEPHPAALEKFSDNKISDFCLTMYRNASAQVFSYRKLRTFENMVQSGESRELSAELLFGTQSQQFLNALTVGKRDASVDRVPVDPDDADGAEDDGE